MSVPETGVAGKSPIESDKIGAVPFSDLTRHDFSFTGSAGEYFGICIRTFLLAVVTLGIYDAWGTVERRRYLLGHTQVAGHGFLYHATPITILKGRLIAVGFMVVYNVAINFFPLVGSAMGLALLVAIPWVRMVALRFNARNTSYRNVRFDFTGDFGEAVKAFLLWPMLWVFTLGLIQPVIHRAQAQFVANNLSFGKSKFHANFTAGALFGPWLCLWLFVVVMITVVSTVSFSFLQGFSAGVSAEAGENVGPIIVVIFAFYFAMLLIMFSYGAYYAAARNIILKATTLEGGHRMDSNLPPFRYLGVAILCMLASTFSLGLLIPWATVYRRRYVLEHTAILVDGDLDDYVAHKSEAGGAFGTEFGELSGVADGIAGGMV